MQIIEEAKKCVSLIKIVEVADEPLKVNDIVSTFIYLTEILSIKEMRRHDSHARINQTISTGCTVLYIICSVLLYCIEGFGMWWSLHFTLRPSHAWKYYAYCTLK